jgi:hypothetical protein
MATLFFNDMTNLSISGADHPQPGSPRAAGRNPGIELSAASCL